MDKKKIGIAVGCAAVIAICAVTFGGKKGDAAEPAATVETAAAAEPAATPEVTADRSAYRNARTYGHTGADGCSHARCDRRSAACCYRCTPARTAGAEQR